MKEYGSPFFSILIPAYNVSGYIEECINSIKKQTYSRWEAVIVDDGSTDGTGEICDRFGSEDGRIRVLHQKNQGVAVTRNVLLKEAKGEYYIFLDGDDFWLSEKMLFEVQEAIGERHADVVAWWLKKFDNETGETNENRNFINEYADCQTGKGFLQDILLNGRNCWWSWLYAFHHTLWKNNGITFNPRRQICEDEEVLFRIFLQAQRVWVMGKYYYAYRIKRKDSVMGHLSFEWISDRLEVAEENIKYLQKDELIEKDLKQSLIRNFSCTWMRVGTNLYRVGGARQEWLRLLKNRKWMLRNLKGYGRVKFRMRVMMVRMFGVRVGLWILWLWEEWKDRLDFRAK